MSSSNRSGGGSGGDYNSRNYGEKRYHHDDSYYGRSGSSYRRRNYKKRKYENSSSDYSSSNNNNRDYNNNNNSNTSSSSSSSYNSSRYPFSIRNVTDYVNQLSTPPPSSSSSSLIDNTNTSNDNNNTTLNNLNTSNDDNNSTNLNNNSNSSNVIRNYFSNSKKYRKIPKGWTDVSPLFGELIPNTKFIPLKCPLSPQYFKFPNNISISLLHEHFQSKFSQDIGLIIDLCCVEFYKRNDVPLNIKYLSYYMNIHDLNKNLNVNLFIEQMNNIVNDIDIFIENNPSKFILIHCTHGLNRTGFVICYYLLKKKIIENVEQAIELFKNHRKSTIGLYNPFFIDLLFEIFNQTNSEMYQLMKYPDPISHSRKSIRKELKFYKPWIKRNDQSECFKNYHILKSINNNLNNSNNEKNEIKSDDRNNEKCKSKDDSNEQVLEDLDNSTSSIVGLSEESNSDKEEEFLEEIDDEELTRK